MLQTEVADPLQRTDGETVPKNKFCRDPKNLINLAGETPAVEALIAMVNTMLLLSCTYSTVHHTSRFAGRPKRPLRRQTHLAPHDLSRHTVLVRHDRTDGRGHQASALAQSMAAAHALRDQHPIMIVDSSPARSVSVWDTNVLKRSFA